MKIFTIFVFTQSRLRILDQNIKGKMPPKNRALEKWEGKMALVKIWLCMCVRVYVSACVCLCFCIVCVLYMTAELSRATSPD